jgi:hypothetical protein
MDRPAKPNHRPTKPIHGPSRDLAATHRIRSPARWIWPLLAVSGRLLTGSGHRVPEERGHHQREERAPPPDLRHQIHPRRGGGAAHAGSAR